MIEFNIGPRKIVFNCPPLIIAELGINHNGSVDHAIHLADVAIKAGAEVIKHQTHIPDDEMSEEAKKIKPGNANSSIYSIIKKCALNEKDEEKLMNYIKSKKSIFISTPFSRAAVDRLGKFNIPAIKIGSGECNNYHLVKYICKLKKPIILSTGMNSTKTISKSIDIIRKNKIPLILLHCTNIYPTPSKLVRLECINQLKETYPNCIIGISDHTDNIYTSLGAVAMGARVIEKHFTDSKKRRGPDISSSMDPTDLKNLIIGSNIIFQARGGTKEPIKEELLTIKFAFQSVVSTKNIYAGEILNKNNIFLRRPGTGIYGVSDLLKLYGKKVKKFIKNNRQIMKNDLV